MAFPVFLDTCTIFGAVLNDLMLRLGEAGAFRILWSSHVLDELEGALSGRIGHQAANRRVSQMRVAFPDAEVEGYESLIERMTCDPKDRHVLAAAVRADAAVIVTFNLRDFPPAALEPFDIEAVHPDAFLQDQLDLFPNLVLEALEDLAESYEQPPLTVEHVLDRLASDVPEFVEEVRGRL